MEHGTVTWPTHEELCERFGVSRRQVVAHSSRGQWLEKRERHRAESALAAVRRDLARRLEEADKAGEKAVAIGRASLGLAAVWISKAHAAGTVEPKELDYVVNAARKAHALVREGLGIPVDLVEAAEGEVRRQRERSGGMAGADTHAKVEEIIAAMVARMKQLPDDEVTALVDEILPGPPHADCNVNIPPPARMIPAVAAAAAPASADDDKADE